MKIQLQKFFHKASPYVRPNQPWVCGKQAQGYECESGPDSKGLCRTGCECIPYKDNDNWVCSRGNAYGGKCSDGAFPDGQCSKKITGCVPTASLRKKRSLIVKWTVSVTLATVLILLNSHHFKARFFSPGELVFKHAKIEECSSCHTIFDKSFFAWIKQAVSGNKIIFSSQECLDCHQFGEHAFNAHGLTTKKLNKLSESKTKAADGDQKIACLSCHREHHGAAFDLTAVSRQNCESCHDLGHSLFKQKHPEFVLYPYKRNTKIIFDHITHAEKYYYNKLGDQLLDTAPESCVSCHSIDKQGVKMLQGGYEKDCKSCHNDLFEEAESFFVIELPEIATDHIEGIEWPEDANGVLTHLMILLLSTDPLFVDAVDMLDEYYDLTELNEDKTIKLIKSIKNLFYAIDKQGQLVFKQRLAQLYNCTLNEQGRFKLNTSCQITEGALDQLVSSLPIDLLCKGKKRWFLNLAKEYKQVSTGDSKESSFCDQNKNQYTQKGQWQLDEFSIEYRPREHADVFIKALLNLTSHQMHDPLAEKIRMQFFNELISEDASVQCTKCHSIESNDGQNFSVNWDVSKGDSMANKFVKFKHDDHIKYQEETVCNNCHHENKNMGFLAGYEDKNPLTFTSNFVTESTDCSSCHQKSMEESQCQSCHNYHVSVQ